MQTKEGSETKRGLFRFPFFPYFSIKGGGQECPPYTASVLFSLADHEHVAIIQGIDFSIQADRDRRVSRTHRLLQENLPLQRPTLIDYE